MIQFIDITQSAQLSIQDGDIMSDAVVDRKDLFLTAEKGVGRMMLVHNSLSPVLSKPSPHTST